ncbi:C40 family peptidase [Paenibacillus harenae]|uniref:Cell wall-associated NlpC family hydrolase n=1 Tax=Paenibacillus harenae TaxID=306543 RepID=A0ABT9U5I2_PAEHA|nr:C40 family peptidase [Paenibacillus harenae]MDQ0062805.1 cell wall-associated NlpC family hydrolase [Paenibacillus harenae]MDQ0113935.1 cell wall-associated NlpC family hydrolase [Paenibacillus harenae]
MKQGFKTKLAVLMMAVSIPATALLNDVSFAASASVEAKRNKVVQTAISLKNKVDYVHWNQRQESKPPYKTDCSGFTYLAYRLANVGVKLVNRDDDDQAKVGQRVAWGKFEKGDLIFTWNGGSKNKSDVGHVGIYIGNGKMIHNASVSKDVVISNVYSSYYKERFIVARRVIK